MASNNKKTFMWDSNSFSGKGSWYLAGNAGKYGRLASASENKKLGKPVDGITVKEIESKTKTSAVFINDSIINNISAHADGFSSVAKNTRELLSPHLVKNVDTTEYTSLGESQTNRLRRGDGVADVAAKIFNLFLSINNDTKIQHEIEHNFEKESAENEAKLFSVVPSAGPGDIPEVKGDKSESPTMSLLAALRMGFEKLNLMKSFEKLLSVGRVIGGFVWKIVKFILPKTPMGKVIGAAATIGAGVYELDKHGVLDPLKQLISKGEGNYNSVNMGTKAGKIIPHEDIDLSKMAVGELMRRQSIKWGDTNESEKILGAGKYQVNPEPLKEAVQKGVLKETDLFTPTNQEKLADNYLLASKRPEIMEYVTSTTDDPTLLHSALKAASSEFASIGNPDSPGGKLSTYGDGNKASISSDTAAIALRKARELYIKSKDVISPKEQEPPPNVTGLNLNNKSVEQADIKKEMERGRMMQSPNVIIDNSTNNNISTYQQNLESHFDDRMEYPSILNYN